MESNKGVSFIVAHEFEIMLVYTVHLSLVHTSAACGSRCRMPLPHAAAACRCRMPLPHTAAACRCRMPLPHAAAILNTQYI